MSAPVSQGGGENLPSAQIATNGATAPSPVAGPAAATPAPSNGSDAGKSSATRDWERDAKEFQSRLDKQEAEFKPIREAMRKHQLDPDRLRNALDEYGALWGDPEARVAVQNFFKTGKLTAAQQAAAAQAATADDGYVDPDIVALRATYDARISELEKRLSGVAQTSQSTASSQVAQTLRGYESDFTGRFEISEQERSEFQAKMADRFQWMVDKQPQALVNLTRETYEDLALPVLHRVVQGGVLSLGQRVASQTQQGIAARATDARTRAPTTGAETLPQPRGFDHTPTHTELQSVARAALDQLNAAREQRR
jgi:hypothetical protein